MKVFIGAHGFATAELRLREHFCEFIRRFESALT